MKRSFACFLLFFSLLVAQIVYAAPNDFSMLAEKCGPAVVNIGTEKKTAMPGPEDFFGEMFKNLPPGFEHFFGFDGNMNPKQRRKGMPKRAQKSLGSGFLISHDGYIVTNNHVVADADTITVTLDNGKGKSESKKAELVGADEETDLALLKIDAGRPLPFLEFGDSDALRVGEWLLAIGNPFGLDHTVTAGILSAKGRDIKAGPFDNFLQTDCSINPGNSGGPLLNMEGKVVGINTAIIASGQGIGFAIPSAMASSIIKDIRQGRKVSRGWLGVTIQEIDEDMAKALGLQEARGALVGQVMSGEPAEKGGVQDGDVILAVDGKAVQDTSELLRTIAAKAPNQTVTLTVWRNGKTMDCSVTLGERQPRRLDSSVKKNSRPKHASIEEIGLSARPCTSEERKKFELPQGEGLMITAIADEQPAQEADLRVGDIILQANMRSVNEVAQLEKVITEQALSRGYMVLKIRRGGNTFFRTLQVKK